MLAQSASYAAYQRARFVRPDAARYFRPDAARWLKPDWKRYYRSGTDLAAAFPALDRKYNPNQPRVPEGNPEGGRWTTEGGSGWIAQATQTKPRQNDPRVLSDADPDVVKPGQQFAQARGRGGGTVLINGQQFQLTPGQAARFEAARARAEESIARVREYEHNWKPPASTDGTPEGRIRSYQADTEAAQARIQWLTENRALPGPFCPEPMEARGPGRSYTLEERRQGNRLGDKYGCNSCGTRDPIVSHGVV
uniref:Uncharacterized protein n=1 Tax=Rhodopseudomonas palustris (strain BisA53) TaxID=316055 RepID=Q07QD5_RHOP5